MRARWVLLVLALTGPAACTTLLGVSDVPSPTDGGPGSDGTGQDGPGGSDTTVRPDGAPADGAGDRSVDGSGDSAGDGAPEIDSGMCASSSLRCNGNQPQTCTGGMWQDTGSACTYVCASGACTGLCTPTSLQCAGLQPQVCDASGQWQNNGAACPSVCNGGTCTACIPNAVQCNGLQPQTCDPGGHWQNTGAPCPFVCSGGSCTGVCSPTSVRCTGLQPQTCSSSGQWQNTGSACPFACSAGACILNYFGEVMSDTPLAYWRLDDTSLAVARDSSGNGNDANYAGGVTFGAPGALFGDPDKAVTLDGTSGFVTAGVKFGFAGTVPFTVEAWIQPTVVDATYRGVVSNELMGGAGKDGYVMYYQSGSGLGFDRYQSGSSTPLTSPGSVVGTTTTWYHVVGSYDTSMNWTLYLNGAIVAGPTHSSLVIQPACTFAIGATHCSTVGFLQGSIDEVAVYGAALPLSRIQAHYHVGSGQ